MDKEDWIQLRYKHFLASKCIESLKVLSLGHVSVLDLSFFIVDVRDQTKGRQIHCSTLNGKEHVTMTKNTN